MTMYVLYEGPTGYAVFQRVASEEIGAADVELQKSLQHFAAFAKMAKLVSFSPFTDPEMALQEAICIAQGVCSENLSAFLSGALPKVSKKAAWQLGVQEPHLGSAIREAIGADVVSNESVVEFSRLLRLHAEKLLPNHTEGDVPRAQCGLGHAFSRNKVKFNVHRSDNMIIQASALLEHMEKGVNLLGMRVKEWYGWHFPELAREVPEPLAYSRLVLLIGNRNSLSSEAAEATSGIAAIVGDDEALAARIYEKAQTSMGAELDNVDWANIEAFAQRVVALAEYKVSVQQYLIDKMNAMAPNLTQLIGQHIGAKLIAKAGSLSNLAKAPASTIQILGAEKALFRALKKKKGNTPKYGIIFHSSFIQRASKENRGKISRYLANKAALACRIDSYMDQPPSVFGERLKEQVEGRLAFFDTGDRPKSNAAAMAEAVEQYEAVLARRARKKSKKAVAASP